MKRPKHQPTLVAPTLLNELVPTDKLHPLQIANSANYVGCSCCCSLAQKSHELFGEGAVDMTGSKKKTKEARRSKEVTKVCKACAHTPVLPDYRLLSCTPLGSVQLHPVDCGHCQHPVFSVLHGPNDPTFSSCCTRQFSNS